MASTGETWRLGRRPALDGVRGIAVLLVLAAHLHLPGAGVSGAVGVVVFFALSGFLITSLLLERRESLGRFYLRRAARLLPAMLACIALYVALQLALTGRINDGRMILGALTYTENWIQATGHYDPNSGVGHMWSLGVEEQFYLLWPIALIALVRLPRRWTFALIFVACLFGLVLRASFGYYQAYYPFQARADELLIGCALAFAMHGARERRAPSWLAAVGLVGILALTQSGPWFSVVWMPTLVALLTAPVLYAAANGGAVRWLRPSWLQWFGERSYGIYLYHLPLRWAVERLGMPWWVSAIIVLALTLKLADVSYRRIEWPVRKWASSRSRQHGESRPAVTVAAGRSA